MSTSIYNWAQCSEERLTITLVKVIDNCETLPSSYKYQNSNMTLMEKNNNCFKIWLETSWFNFCLYYFTALARSLGTTIPFFETLVCIKTIWHQRSSGYHTRGKCISFLIDHFHLWKKYFILTFPAISFHRSLVLCSVSPSLRAQY